MTENIMMLQNVICWTNRNVGFVTALFSFITILFSVISVGIALKALRAPYKRNLLITMLFVKHKSQFPDCSEINLDFFVRFSIVNTGNREIAINSLQIRFENHKEPIPIDVTNEQKRPLKPASLVTIQCKYKDLEKALEQENKSTKKFKKCTIIAQDLEGKQYKVKGKELIEFMAKPESYDHLIEEWG